MVRDYTTYQQALALRARGFTMTEIARVCAVSKSTISKWLKNNDISATVTKQNKQRAGQANAKRLQIIRKARAAERALRYQEAGRSAALEYGHFKSAPLFVAGLMLYSAHGDHTQTRSVRVTTVDQAAHRIFQQFAVTYLGVAPRAIRMQLCLYPAHDASECLAAWRTATGLPTEQFYKTQTLTSNQTAPLHFGVGNTIINGTILQQKLAGWLEQARLDLVALPK